MALANERVAQLSRELEELRSRPVEVAVQHAEEEELEQARREAAADARVRVEALENELAAARKQQSDLLNQHQEMDQKLKEARQARRDAMDAQKANDLAAQCDRFEKKLHDLELTRTIAMQTAPQIRLIQNNDTVMVEKIQTTIVNTIPLWKSQMVLALGIAHSAEAAQAQRQVTDITNELLRKNAETLHMVTVETAKESERGIVDLETLQKTNADLIQTLDDVMRIQMEGRQKRQAAEMEMHRMEEELKRKLLEIR